MANQTTEQHLYDCLSGCHSHECRENNKVINKAVHIVMAYDLNGYKHILGHYISSGGEGAKYWLSVITDLKNRGVQDILIACIDGLTGFEQAIHSIFHQSIVLALYCPCYS